MTTRQVVLPREVAKALNEFLADGHSHQIIMTAVIVIGAGPSTHLDETLILKRYSAEGGFTNIMNALVNGYEVEQTPEENVRNYFNTITPDGWKYTGDARDPVYVERNAIRTTAILLGHTVEGVNA